jgi:hypothetical protein
MKNPSPLLWIALSLIALLPSITCLSTTARVFVGGLGPTIQADDLERTFQQFGPVTEVSLMNFKTAAPYAFVTFASGEAADRALQFVFADESYQVKPARRVIPRQNSQQRREKSAQEWEDKLRIAKRSNVVVQVHKSHLERLEDFFGADSDGQQGQQTMGVDVEVIGTVPDSGSKTVGLLGLRVSDTALFLQTLRDLPFTAVALNKVYLVDDYFNMDECDSSSADLTTQAIQKSVQQVSRGSIVRLHAFPPKLTSSILKALEEYQDDNIQVAPTGHTHVLNVVQLQSLSLDGNKKQLWMTGISERSMAWSRMQHRVGADGSTVGTSRESDDDICRAYYKLQEAFCRYNNGQHSIFESSAQDGLVALDCGASPGGWTKYLCEQGSSVKRVYSIDPGALDPTVESLPQVHHLCLKVEEALPTLKGVHVDLWASDMCLHQMSEQIDWLLYAKDAGVAGKGTFFVLTLKCKVGHSKASFDSQVAQECKRLEGITRDLQVFHLFSNRSGERTIMGYLR